MNTPGEVAKVGIIIPCYQEEKYIEQCILSCLKQNTTANLHVYVVDGQSQDQSVNRIQKISIEYPGKVSLLMNKMKVTPISLNIGLKASQDDFKMILGAHSILPENFIQECLMSFHNEPSADCVGGIIENQYSNKTSEDIGMAMSSVFGVGNATFRTGGEAKWVDTVAFGMYRKEVFEKIGWFNEDLIRNQDDEFNFRMTQAGMSIYFNPTIRSAYFVRSSYFKLWNQYFQYGFWKVYVNLLHKRVTTFRQLFPALFIAYFLLGISFAFKKNKKRTFPITLVFLLLHLGYGLGYWKGIIQLGVFKLKPKEQDAKHNR
jgi:glycosyltransferase involved in cell wall biosynthesis